jgi:hypothetical protein
MSIVNLPIHFKKDRGIGGTSVKKLGFRTASKKYLARIHH